MESPMQRYSAESSFTFTVSSKRRSFGVVVFALITALGLSSIAESEPSLPPGAPGVVFPAHYHWSIAAAHGIVKFKPLSYTKGHGAYAEHASALDVIVKQSEDYTLETAPSDPGVWDVPVALYRTSDFIPGPASGAFDATWSADLRSKSNGNIYHNEDWGWWNTSLNSIRACPRGYKIWDYKQSGVLIERFCKRNPSYFSRDENAGEPARCDNGFGPSQPFAGNPINVGTGNKYQKVPLFSHATSPLKVDFHYNSQLKRNFWSHTYSAKLNSYMERILSDPLRAQEVSRTEHISLKASRPDGQVIRFRNVITNWTTLETEEQQWHDYNHTGYQLIGIYGANAKLDSFELRSPNGDVEFYDIGGKLVRIRYATGEKVTLSYIDDELSSVQDAFGNQVTFQPDDDDLYITDPAGNIYHIHYSKRYNHVYARIESITYPDATPGDNSDNPSEIFHYKDPDSRLLVGIVDENGNQASTWTYKLIGYDIWGADSSKHALDTESYTLSYNGLNTTVTDPLGNTTTYKYVLEYGQKKLKEVVGNGCLGCGSDNVAVTYDENGFVASKTDRNGNLTTYTRDDLGRQIIRIVGDGAAENHWSKTVWNSVHPHKPLRYIEVGRLTKYTYNANGQVLTKTVKDTTTGEERKTTYTYTPEGKVETIDGPRTDITDVTIYTYDDLGNRETMTDALGHVTQYADYDGMGRLLRMVDPNGLVTRFTYTPRGWLESQSVGEGASATITLYEYDDVGNLEKITLPSGATLTYHYDEANRLDGITDDKGNSIGYTLDTMGNRRQEEVRDDQGTLWQSQQWVYNNLNQLEQHLGAEDQATGFDYDDNGNQTHVTDPLNRITEQRFDVHDRVESTVDADSLLTSYTYTKLGHLETVTDARGNVTTYDTNAFGDITRRVSPDTGVTSYVHDGAGNVTQMMDARSIVTQYGYDALNRLEAITFPADSSENVTFSYDDTSNGNAGIGRRTGMSDPSGSTSYRFDVRGNLVEETALLEGLSFAIGRDHDALDRLAAITYPSGRIVNYYYDTYGRITDVTTQTTTTAPEQPIVSNADYNPLGALSAYTQGNGITTDLNYDLDGRVSQISATGTGSIRNVIYQYDEASQIEVLDFADNSLDRVYDYDNMSRLEAETGPFGSHTYLYDALGNRTKRNNQNYVYDSFSNRLTLKSGKALTYDAMGNTETALDGVREYSHNQSGRLASFTNQGVLKETYRYDGLGRRRVTQTNKPILYFYGDGSQYLSQTELNNSGTFVKKTFDIIWMGTMPVAQFTTTYTANGNISSSSLIYIHADHLNTPRLATDEVAMPVWAWEEDGFGAIGPDQDVDGDGTDTVLHLRFPGQIKSPTTAMLYNYFRDYDPATGRYIQSDPIGLDGGINTYAYVGGNPLRWADPLGLCKCVAKGKTGDKFSAVSSHWWGLGRKITCTYECESNGRSEEVRATHRERNFAQWSRQSDDGREGHCLGAQFGPGIFNPYTLRTLFSRSHFDSFSPKDSGSDELEDWAKENCKDGKC